MGKTKYVLGLLLCTIVTLVVTSRGVLTTAGAITLTSLTEFTFNNPIGIDFHEPNGGNLILSVNWPNGAENNLDLVNVTTKQATTFSTLKDLTDELKIATQRTSACRQFPIGDVFTGNGRPGEIVRLNAAGAVYGPQDLFAPGDGANPLNPNPGVPANFSWVKLRGALPDDLLRGSLYVDRCNGFNGDLIVATSIDAPFPVHGGGAVWRISATGVATMLNGGNRIVRAVGDHCAGAVGETCGVHFEGVITVPVGFVPWGGTIIAGDENDNTDLSKDGKIWSIPASGAASAFSLAFNLGGVHHPVKAEDLDIIDGDNFFGVNFGNARLLTAPKSDFAGSVGDILLTQEFPCGNNFRAVGVTVTPCIGGGGPTTGLYAIHSDGVRLTITPFTFSGTSLTNIDTWEHVTFAPLELPVPSVKIVKLTNGTDNDTPTGPVVLVGSTVTWTYIVTNTGNVTLTNVTVTDDKIAGTICTIPTLAAGATTSCTKTGIAVAGQYENTGTVKGTPPSGPDVTDSNPDHYFAAAPAIKIVKKTNGTDNDVPPGPTVAVGSTVTWTYLVTNTGNVPLTEVTVTDNKIGAITCPATTLVVGASMTCTATGIAVAGQYANIGSVTGKPPLGPNVTDSNPDHYFAAQLPSNVKIRKVGNGPVKIGDKAIFTITVTSLGPGSATNVTITDTLPAGLTWVDNQAACTIAGGIMTCNIGTMAPGQVFTVVLTATVTRAAFDCNCFIDRHHDGDGCDHDRRKNGHHDGDGCEHDKDVHARYDHEHGKNGHHDGDGCEHDKKPPVDCRIKNTAIVTASNEDPTKRGDNSSTASIALATGPTHHHGDDCDHERGRDGHHDGDGCDHEKATHHHFDGDGCDHERGKSGHHAGDSCDHERTKHPERHYEGDRCAHDRGRNGHRDGDGCTHDKDVRRHLAGDRCDHDRGVKGHHDGDGCAHEKDLHFHYAGDGDDHEKGRFGHKDGDGCDHDKHDHHVFDHTCIVKH